MENWKQSAIYLRLERGYSWMEIVDELQDFFPGKNKEQVKEAIRTVVRRSPQYKAAQEGNGKITPVYNPVPRETFNRYNGEKIVRFAICGDTHLNSKYAQISHLHSFYDECAREGIDTVYHCGDIDDGEQMRPGHQYDLVCQGADEHVSEIVRLYPKRTGIKTRFITGNHDASMMKRCGYNIGPRIAMERTDMEYLGSDCARVWLTPTVDIQLRHPWDGASAYSISYKVQRMIEGIDPYDRPKLLSCGHYHKAGLFRFGGVEAFMVPCFQSDTPFTIGKNIQVAMGGYIVELRLDDDGEIKSILPRHIEYKKAIKDDYKNWR